MIPDLIDLAELGWGPFFLSQLDSDDLETTAPARVIAVHRDGLRLHGADFTDTALPFRDGEDDEDTATVGDWLLVERKTHRPQRLLARKSLFKRRAAGTGRKIQLIAANVDTLFIVTSCNQDFNVARLERYLALAREAEVMPVILLTKADLAEEPADYVRAAEALSPGLFVEALDARLPDQAERLAPWCGRGATVALIGSSGVGKSTLVNSLTRNDTIATQGIREDDAKGRHTTTGRQLHRLPGGGWLMDTPGMRELQLTDSRAGIDAVFDDIVELARRCRFSDCRHEDEPGCAVRKAMTDGVLDAARLKRWNKLTAEEAYNRESIAERRQRERGFGKMVREAMKAKKRR
ncbi:MAG: ribosome small subunit-dependent GTPase A [Rhizobiaceae bacterium]